MFGCGSGHDEHEEDTDTAAMAGSRAALMAEVGGRRTHWCSAFFYPYLCPQLFCLLVDLIICVHQDFLNQFVLNFSSVILNFFVAKISLMAF
jgi:hypothetical protein